METELTGRLGTDSSSRSPLCTFPLLGLVLMSGHQSFTGLPSPILTAWLLWLLLQLGFVLLPVLVVRVEPTPPPPPPGPPTGLPTGITWALLKRSILGLWRWIVSDSAFNKVFQLSVAIYIQEINPEYSLGMLKLQYFSYPMQRADLLERPWCWERLKTGGEGDRVGWHHRLDRHEFEQALGVDDGQGSLVCFRPGGRKELDTTEWLNGADIHFMLLLS